MTFDTFKKASFMVCSTIIKEIYISKFINFKLFSGYENFLTQALDITLLGLQPSVDVKLLGLWPRVEAHFLFYRDQNLNIYVPPFCN